MSSLIARVEHLTAGNLSFSASFSGAWNGQTPYVSMSLDKYMLVDILID